MKLRKFQIISVESEPGGPGPERFFRIKYSAIKNKIHVVKTLSIAARNESEARKTAMSRFGGIN